MEKIEIFADYHTHTTHSHGTGSVVQNVEAAIAAGLSEIAISDHGPGHLAYGVRNIQKYLDDIHRAQDMFAGKIRVLSAIECNLLSLQGYVDLSEKYADSFDIVIFGYHKLTKTQGFTSTAHLYALGKKAAEKNTQAYILALNNYRIDIVSHPGYGIIVDAPLLAAECAKTNTAFEINNKHCDFSNDILSECAKTGCKFVLSSDAHSSEKVGDVKNAAERALAAHVPASQIINAKTEVIL